MSKRPGHCRGYRRRAAIAVFVAVMLPVFLAFTMLVVDVGMLYSAKADLQRAADAAALAGASAFLTDAALLDDTYDVQQLARTRTQYTSSENPTLKDATLVEISDIVVGQHDFDHPTAALSNAHPWNAVEVTVRRSPDSPNGPVPFFFAHFFGKRFGSVTATARAAVMDRMAGYRFAGEPIMTPFTIHEALYQNMVDSGSDEYAFDGSGIRNGTDEIKEIRLFPWKWKDEAEALAALELPPGDPNGGAGNFGTLNIGLGNQGTSFLREQIEDGIEPDELISEFDTSELIFVDEYGSAQTYSATGNPGMSAGMASALEARVGDVIGFFTHTGYPQSDGSNASFKISGIRFGRVMAVDLTGNPDQRTIIIQPVARSDSNLIIREDAPSTDGLLGRIMLVK